MEFSIQEIINQIIREQREEKEIKSWHISLLGGCLTSAYLVRKGLATKEFNDRQLRIFSVGKMFEEWVINLIKRFDSDFQSQVGVGISLINNEITAVDKEKAEFTGYVDLIVNDIVYEIKTKHSKFFDNLDKYGANEQHKMQLWTYLKALSKKEGRLLYISKDDLRIEEFVIFDNDEIGEIVKKEMRILNEAWKRQLPPEPVRDKNDWRYRYCPIHEEYCLKQEKYLKVV